MDFLEKNIGFLKQTVSNYDLDYEIVKSIYIKSKNYTDFYNQLEEEIEGGIKC